ncbi:MAG: signal peptidase II [Phycisphaerales bacterium]|nr:signal peptidase II [Planctomycetota bacterium]
MSDHDSKPAGPRGTPAWRSPAAWVLLTLVVVCGLAWDLSSKWWAFRSIADAPVVFTREQALSTAPLSLLVPSHRPMVVVPNLLNFTLVLNPGAVFGIGAGKTGFFIAVTIIAVAFGVGVFVFATRSRDWMAHIGLGLILAGGLGNLYDRLLYGCVRDFIHPLPKVRWPGTATEVWPYVSNVADLLLLVGMCLLLLHAWRGEKKTAPIVATA